MKKYYWFALYALLIPTASFADTGEAHSSWMRQILFPYINFVLFIGLVIYLVRKPMHKFLSDRKRHAEMTIKESAQMYAQAQTDIQQAKLKTAQLAETLHTLRTNLHAEAQAEQQRLTDQVRAQANQLRQDLEKQIHADEIMAKQALQIMLVNSMENVARQAVKANIKPEEQQRFSQEFISDIKDIPLSHTTKEAI